MFLNYEIDYKLVSLLFYVIFLVALLIFYIVLYRKMKATDEATRLARLQSKQLEEFLEMLCKETQRRRDIREEEE